MNIKEKLYNLIAKQFGVSVDSLGPDTRFIEDVKAKSLDIMEFIYNIEDAFEIEVEDDVIRELTTIGKAQEYIESHLG